MSLLGILGAFKRPLLYLATGACCIALVGCAENKKPKDEKELLKKEC